MAVFPACSLSIGLVPEADLDRTFPRGELTRSFEGASVDEKWRFRVAHLFGARVDDVIEHVAPECRRLEAASAQTDARVGLSRLLAGMGGFEDRSQQLLSNVGDGLLRVSFRVPPARLRRHFMARSSEALLPFMKA
jgi:hypothetical protein